MIKNENQRIKSEKEIFSGNFVWTNKIWYTKNLFKKTFDLRKNGPKENLAKK